VPSYDFRCRDCGVRRAVRAGWELARDLTLVCVACGGTMRKAFSPAVYLVAGSGRNAPVAAPSRRRRGGDSCDAAVRLTRSNPFAGRLEESTGDA